MIKPAFTCITVLLASACTTSSPETQANRSGQVETQVGRIQPLLTAPVIACGSLIAGNGLGVSTLQTNGFRAPKIGAGYQKRVSKGTFANPNGSTVTVAQTRRGGCNILLTGLTNLQLGSVAMTRALTSQGWRRDASTKKLLYRKGSAALLLNGSSFGSIVTFTLQPA